MHSASVKGVGNNAICEMNLGAAVMFVRKNSKAVAVNAVAETTFVPLAKMSAVLPFHLIAILVVSVVVVYSDVRLPEIVLKILIRPDDSPCNNLKLFPVRLFVSPKSIASLPKSPTYATLFNNLTNQVPPLDVIKPFV